ncbi:hypothetical protein WMY93_018119 [Mugilogobius chulae]|uniref:DEP domain-containing protein n=1 Tax=Mugilogobius chulae TaxID=88201 RepID=A0AAW0NT61_9GOBI
MGFKIFSKIHLACPVCCCQHGDNKQLHIDPWEEHLPRLFGRVSGWTTDVHRQLFPALLECFGIIMCGYIAGRTDIITESQAKGLGNFVSKFALPALLFKNMVLLDFGDVIWAFLWSVLVTVFVLVCVLTLMVASPESRYSKAGLYAIFATQSNDFALGYPIVEALYRSTYPEYLQYIYLVAPVSLMILNPIGFALCEIQRWRQASHPERVGQLRKLTRDTGVALILLITAKLLVMPLVCKDMVEILDVGVNSSSPNHTSLSNFAFLYGVFPTAPSVAIYAAHYNMELEVVTSGMVISTFLSAPIMYVSAWLLTIPLMDPTPLITELQNVSFNISVICLLALFLVCVSMILWNFLVKQEENLVGKVITFTMLYGSLYSTYIWTGLIPLCLALTNRDDLLRLRPGVFMILGWGEVPFVMVGCLLLVGERTDSIDSAFFYGKSQIICSAVILAVSLVLGALSLMGLSQGSREQSGYEALSRAAVTGLTDDLQPSGGVEEQQQQQLPPLLISSPSLSALTQGFLSFGIFGLDKHLILLPFIKRMLALWHGRDSSDLPSASVPEEVRLTCTQFVRYHKEQCVQDLVHTRSVSAPEDRDGEAEVPPHLGPCSSVFRGSELVEWLLERGLCAGRGEAQLYGGRLLMGGVIQHQTGLSGFEDTLLYSFTNTDGERWTQTQTQDA